ncbi:MAG TPA: hypothetical protein VMU80_25340 [Bryobacteraceae bacterium]|nr:hypothetical protein [Bryobacteraceae bacterium]
MPARLRTSERLMAIAQVAGVLATGWFVWITRVQPQAGSPSVASLAVEALCYTVAAWFSGAVITFCIYMVVALADLPEVINFSLRSSAPAMWFAPAVILLSIPMPAALAASLVLIGMATRQLVSRWATIEAPALGPVFLPDPSLLFQSRGPNTTFLSWDAAPVLVVAMSAQAGVVALLWRHQITAGALFAASAATLTSLSIVVGAYRPEKPVALPNSMLSIFLTLLLSVALSFGGIQVRRNGWANTGADSQSVAPAGGQPGAFAYTRIAPPPSASVELGGGFPGVILLPEPKPRTTLVMPALAKTTKAGVVLPETTALQFSGEYWMYKPPAKRPPVTSIVRQGLPSEISFHTTDGAPMEMEAYQRLDRPIDLRCCRQIQVSITDTDRYPGTVSLELVLIDGASNDSAVSLGTVLAASDSLEQTVSFRVPPMSRIRQFDLMKVVFHRARLRLDRSAKIAIDRFVFMP